MRLQRLDFNQQIQITDESRKVVQTYFKIPGTYPDFNSNMFLRRDRRNIRDLVEFLWEHSIDAYVHAYADKSYSKIDVLALARDPELYLMAESYLLTKINSLPPDRTLRIGGYVKGKGGEIKRQRNGLPKIKGRKFDVRLLLCYEFTNVLSNPCLGLKLIPKSFFKGKTIDLVIVPEDSLENHEKARNQKRIWQEWLKSGNDVYYIY